MIIMTNSICDIFPFKQASIFTNYHIVRDYQVTIVYCDVSRCCIQYKKSGTFKLVPQPSYLSKRSKAFTNLQSSLQFLCIFYYLSIYLASTYIRQHHLNLLAFGNLFTKLVLHTRQFRLSKANSSNSIQHDSTTTGN